MSSRYIGPFFDVGSGIKPSSGSKLFFFEPDGVTPKDTFSDQLTTPTPNTNPVIANSNGVFGDIFISGEYKNTLKDKNDIQIFGGVVINEIIDSTFLDKLNPATLAIAIADTTLEDGDVLHVAERTTGNGGPGIWRVVLKSTVTISSGAPAFGEVVASTGDTTLALVLEIKGNIVDAAAFGAVMDGVSDDAPALNAIKTRLTVTGGVIDVSGMVGNINLTTELLLTGGVVIQGADYHSSLITGTAATLVRLAGLRNGVKNIRIKAGAGTTRCLEIHGKSTDPGNTSSNNVISRVWLDGTGKSAHGLYYDASDTKPNLWNIVDGLVIRDCNIGIAFKANEVTNSIFSYNNSNHFSHIDMHTVNTGWKMVTGALVMSGLSGTFTDGETVTGGTSGATGVVKTQATTTLLKIDNSVGIWSATETLTGGTSGATATFDFTAGDAKGNKFSHYEIGAAAVNEMDFGQAVTDRNIISAYMSFDFVGSKKIEDSNSLNMGGCIIQGNGVNKLYAMDALEFSTVPLEVIRRGTTGTGSVFQKFINATKEITIGLNTGKSGAPLHVDDRLHATKAGSAAIVAESTGSGTVLSVDRSDGTGSSLIEIKNTGKTALIGLDAGKSRTPISIDTELEIAGAFRIPDSTVVPATITGVSQIYVDNISGDLTIKFGDGTIKTIATNP